MSVKNNTFLFTGQLRHKKKLVRSIIELKFLFLFDEIIISTWKEELESKIRFVYSMMFCAFEIKNDMMESVKLY